MSRPQTPRPLCKAATYIMPRCNLWFGFQTKILTWTNLAYTWPAMFWSTALTWPLMSILKDSAFEVSATKKIDPKIDHKSSYGVRCRCTRASKRFFAFFAPNIKCIHHPAAHWSDNGMQIKSTDAHQIWNSVEINRLLEKEENKEFASQRDRENLI